jgi:hypothetical protein
VDFEFDDATSAGTFFGEYSRADDLELAEREDDGQFGLPTFERPDGTTVTQLWNLEYSGTHNGLIHLTFAYDPTLLPPGFDENALAIYHYNGTTWERLAGTVNAAMNKITVTTSSLSPFALGRAPDAVNIGANVSTSGGGTVVGAGTYANGASVTLTATPEAGYRFVNWTDNGTTVGTATSYTFSASAGRTVVANFELIIPQLATAAAAANTMTIEWPADLPGWILEESPDLSPGSWVPSAATIGVNGANRRVIVTPTPGCRFFRLRHP